MTDLSAAEKTSKDGQDERDDREDRDYYQAQLHPTLNPDAAVIEQCSTAVGVSEWIG